MHECVKQGEKKLRAFSKKKLRAFTKEWGLKIHMIKHCAYHNNIGEKEGKNKSQIWMGLWKKVLYKKLYYSLTIRSSKLDGPS